MTKDQRNLPAIVVVVLGVLCVATQIQAQEKPAAFLYPSVKHVAAQENILTFVLRPVQNGIAKYAILVPWDTVMSLTLATQGERAAQIDRMANDLPQGFLLGSVALHLASYHTKADSMRMSFPLTVRKSAVTFFLNDTSNGIPQTLRRRDAGSGRISISGWVMLESGKPSRAITPCPSGVLVVSARVLPGRNQIVVESRSVQQAVVQADTLMVDHVVEVDGQAPPAGAAQIAFHRSREEAGCEQCHAKRQTKQVAGTVQGPACDKCHSGLLQQKSVHGLLESGLCDQCHSTAPGYAPLYTPEQENAKCFTCHESMGSAISAGKVVHAPAASGSCSMCHSPHGSPFRANLRRDVNDICNFCHQDQEDGNHPVVFHPSAGKPDPRMPGQELSCVSCHDPHASDNKSMLRQAGSYFALCQSCHKK